MTSEAAAVVLLDLSGSTSRNISKATFAFALILLRPTASSEGTGAFGSTDGFGESPSLLLGAGFMDHLMESVNEFRSESSTGRMD